MPAGPPLLAAPSARDAVAGAGLVFTATSVAADMSLVHADWLAPGAIVCALGSFREVDPSVVATASEIVVDDLQGVQARGNLAAEFRAGRLSPDRIAADVGALLSGRWTPRAGRSGPVLMAMVGMGVLDVALAARALGNARRAGLGLPLAGRKP
jgi:ornithine cyclodeaminase